MMLGLLLFNDDDWIVEVVVLKGMMIMVRNWGRRWKMMMMVLWLLVMMIV